MSEHQIMPNLRRRRLPLYYQLKALGLTTNLKLCLDAGDIASYDGSSQTWNDVSGGGYDFNLGTSSSSDSADPVFNGTAGAQTAGEYFEFDGADLFTLGQANPTWIQNLHKAGMKFSLIGWLYRPTPGSVDQSVFATRDNVSEVGFTLFFNDDGSNSLQANVSNGTSEILQIGITGSAFASNAWNYFAFSYDAGSSTASAAWIGSTTSAGSGTIGLSGTPSSSSAAQTARIGKGFSYLINGTRISKYAMWGGTALSHHDMAAIGEATRGPFGV